MNKWSVEQRVRIVACMVEGNSMRATVRMTGAAKKTVSKLLVDMGTACSAFQDRTWAFCGAKAKNATPEQKQKGGGDIWTWTAIDADSKLVGAGSLAGATRQPLITSCTIFPGASRIACSSQLTASPLTTMRWKRPHYFGVLAKAEQIVDRRPLQAKENVAETLVG